MPSDLCALTAVEAVACIARGELRAEAYVTHLLARHRAFHALNTVTWIDAERVLEAARAIDRQRARGDPLGMLAGLPLIIKDNIDVAGTPSAAATPALRDNVARTNAPVVARLLDAGAVFFAKANMHELAGGATSSNPATGAVRNPYDPTRIPGGSSGGTAAALAARIVPAGLGTDTAGSVRIPSALCGTAALRPSTLGRKRYSADGVVPLALELDTIGPMARTVADLTLLHAAITGARTLAPPALREVRIGVPRRYYWEDLEPEVARVAEDALQRLRAAGATLVDVDVSAYYPLASEIYMTLGIYGIKEDLARYLAQVSAGITADQVIERIASLDTKALYERARAAPLTAALVDKARAASRDRVVPSYRELFRSAGICAIAFPTEPVVAPAINERGDTAEDLLEINGQYFSEVLTLIRNTHVTPALGAPGVSLPAGLSSHGLPIGLELDALPGGDDELLALGVAVEALLGRLPAPGDLDRQRRSGV